MESEKKLALLAILDILKKESDENHYLMQKDIIKKLDAKGIHLERKTVSLNLELLQDLEFDINQKPHKGYALLSREFEKSEVEFLIDAVFSSKSITNKQAYDLTNKIVSCLSKYDQKEFSPILKKTSSISRTSNKQLFLNIEIINEAIKKNKQISFYYLSYNEDGDLVHKEKKIRTAPYFIINNFGKYYLLSNYDRHDDINIYRLEFMAEIEIIDKDSRPYKSIPKFGEKFSISKYINDHIYMFSVDVINAKVEILDEKAITYIYDWFGKSVKISTARGKRYARIRCDEKAFFYWCMQYCEHIKVIEPINIKDKIIETAKELIKRYEE